MGSGRLADTATLWDQLQRSHLSLRDEWTVAAYCAVARLTASWQHGLPAAQLDQLECSNLSLQ
eukprot:1306922-Karenia_brevis.AAC.1